MARWRELALAERITLHDLVLAGLAALVALGAVVFIPVTLRTAPEDMDRLVRYYVMTRPIGWWKPVHREAVRRGLVEDAEPVQNRSGAFVRRNWTAAEAERYA